MVAVAVDIEVIKCRECSKPIARRFGARLVYESNSANVGFVGSGVVTIQCPHFYRDGGRRFVPCRTNNDVLV